MSFNSAHVLFINPLMKEAGSLANLFGYRFALYALGSVLYAPLVTTRLLPKSPMLASFPFNIPVLHIFLGSF